MSKFQIDPRLQMILAFLVGALTFVGATALPPEVPTHLATAIHDWSNYIGSFYLTVVTPLLLAFTNSNPGPLAPPDPPGVIQAAQAAKDQKP